MYRIAEKLVPPVAMICGLLALYLYDFLATLAREPGRENADTVWLIAYTCLAIAAGMAAFLFLWVRDGSASPQGRSASGTLPDQPEKGD